MWKVGWSESRLISTAFLLLQLWSLLLHLRDRELRKSEIDTMISILYYIIKVSWWGVRQYSEQFVAGGHYLFMCRLWRYCAQYLPWQKHLPLLWSHGKITKGNILICIRKVQNCSNLQYYKSIDWYHLSTLLYRNCFSSQVSMFNLFTPLVTWPEYSWAALDV